MSASLPSLVDLGGKGLSKDEVEEKLQGKRVALYFSAGWCPMCTSFEPDLQKFRETAAEAGKPVELIYISSDRKDGDAAERANSLGMITIPYEESNGMKTKYSIWAGSETAKLGTGRRSGVPALVVLDKSGSELAFVAAESQGAKSLNTWPMDDVSGIW